MENVEAKLIAKYRKNAIDWHKSKYADKPAQEKVEEKAEGASVDEVKKQSFDQELALIEDLKNVVMESTLEENRKPIFLGILRSAEEKLRAGTPHERLPDIVRNLTEKGELKNGVLEATKRHSVDDQSFYYLWGLK
jgi:hypothetical protein